MMAMEDSSSIVSLMNVLANGLTTIMQMSDSRSLKR